ncbi:hypothetical protein PRIPAC_87700 [Pristionchus pacificus]|uniref:G protein-coupled receptor n=1 Tax=Pristionchus pacificus TaxID=54126 RepID=A0A2A6CW59_PRIPA|nr:hypothetical protein PRIPAC_87700 [Pristionchus pacificus]|eukprot:PDM82273.1 G protein-coupled receptor [Pristionchus pacificus]
MMATPLGLSCLHYLVCSLGTITNIVLVAIIVLRTPRSMKSYSILLLSQTLLQATTCISSAMVFMRLIPQDTSVFFAMSGRLFGSYKIQFYLYAVMLHGHAHYSIMLAVCFSYRLYVILYPIPRVQTASIAVILIYLPTIIIFTWFAQSTLYDPFTAKQILAQRGPDYIFDEDELVTGVVNVLEPSVITGIVWVCTPCIPAYAIMIVSGRMMYQILAANKSHMSERTRAAHREIAKGLVLQACLPAVYIFSCGTYLFGQLNILRSVPIEYITHMAGEWSVTISPFLTLYFVKPYRRSMKKIISKENIVSLSHPNVIKGVSTIDTEPRNLEMSNYIIYWTLRCLTPSSIGFLTRMSPPLLISIFHYAMCAFGTIVNISLLVIIVMRTPANLTCYAILLFSQTLLQSSTCFTSAIIFVRLIPKDVSLFLVISGPASYLGSYQIGYYLWSIMLHGHAHYCIMLAICFTYRYYVIRYPSPNFSTIVSLVIIVYLPTIWLSQSPLFEQEISKAMLAPRGPAYEFEHDEVVAGIPNVLEPAVFTGIVWVCGVILIVGRSMYKTLAANAVHMSERTRASHKEIVRGLVMQACLPALYSFACVTYIVGQLNILNIEALEYGTHLSGEIIVTASPLMTLYFVQPYRRTVRRVVSNRDATLDDATTSSHFNLPLFSMLRGNNCQCSLDLHHFEENPEKFKFIPNIFQSLLDHASWYYVILHSSSSFNTVVILTLIIYLPTPIIFWWFAQTPLFNEQTAKRLLLPKGPCYAFEDDEMVTGIPNVLYPSAITGIVWVCAPCLPAYTVILIVGRRMYQTLAANVTHMSERTRSSHKQIVKGLAFQACLPALYSFSVGTYVVGQLNILHLVPLEYITHIVGEICVASSPFMTLYFVQPYRRILQRVTSKRDTVVTISLVPSTHR